MYFTVKPNVMANRAAKYFLLVQMFLIPFFAFNQNGHYLGKEKNIDNNFLLKKAGNTNFNNNPAALIFKDIKNSYYAVDLSKLPSRYEKIRFLEYTYNSKELTNIYNDINGKYMLFLVDNSLNIAPSRITDILSGFKSETEKELKGMNEQEVKTWLKEHDKYIKKQ
jgi:hypothetical protein